MSNELGTACEKVDNKPEIVLVVDDDAATLEMLGENLAAAGYEPMPAENAFRALEILRDYQIRIVIADWIMPKMDGLKLCRRIKSLKVDYYIYIIMLTIRSDKNSLVEAFDAGVDDFLAKPFYRDELLARIRAGVRMVHVYDKLREQTATALRLAAETSRLNIELKRMAGKDELTALLNRRQAISKLTEQLAAASKLGQHFCWAMVDIDHFKRINDTYGHFAGDEVLRKVAQVLLKSVRVTDFVFRYGGDEFLIIFPQATVAQACNYAERCKASVASELFDFQGHVEQVTISVGIVEYDQQMNRVDALLQAADKALYAAKENGRNTIITTATYSV